MRIVTWCRFPIKKLLIDSTATPSRRLINRTMKSLSKLFPTAHIRWQQQGVVARTTLCSRLHGTTHRRKLFGLEYLLQTKVERVSITSEGIDTAPPRRTIENASHRAISLIISMTTSNLSLLQTLATSHHNLSSYISNNCRETFVAQSESSSGDYFVTTNTSGWNVATSNFHHHAPIHYLTNDISHRNEAQQHAQNMFCIYFFLASGSLGKTSASGCRSSMQARVVFTETETPAKRKDGPRPLVCFAGSSFGSCAEDGRESMTFN